HPRTLGMPLFINDTSKCGLSPLDHEKELVRTACGDDDYVGLRLHRGFVPECFGTRTRDEHPITARTKPQGEPSYRIRDHRRVGPGILRREEGQLDSRLPMW